MCAPPLFLSYLAWSDPLLEVVLVFIDVARPLGRYVGVRKDRLNGALGLAGPAIDALVWVNVELIFTVINAVDRTNLDAAGVLGPDTRLDNDVGHVPNESS